MEDVIDYDRKTPYTLERYEIKDGIKYKIIYTINRGVADSRIVTYEIEKIGEEIER
jgi:hypothetical protein